MVFFNWATMQMAAKIVYYGPGLCGKTTNLSYIYAKTSPTSRGEMVSLETESDRTLFFDLLPIEVGTIGGFKTRLQLYTVPGQVFYNTTRKLVLKGVDGVVFVADSQRPMREANAESFANLKENLRELGLSLEDVPLVIQYNKRDLKNILSLEELGADLNSGDVHPYFEAIAIDGTGVFETLKEITKLTLKKLRRRMAPPQAGVGTVPKPVRPPTTVAAPPRATAISAAALARAAEEAVESAPPAREVAAVAEPPAAKPGRAHLEAVAEPEPVPAEEDLGEAAPEAEVIPLEPTGPEPGVVGEAPLTETEAASVGEEEEAPPEVQPAAVDGEDLGAAEEEPVAAAETAFEPETEPPVEAGGEAPLAAEARAEAEVEVDFAQSDVDLSEIHPPPLKRVQVTNQMDILAELDSLRKQATMDVGSLRTGATPEMDLDSLLAGELQRSKELRRKVDHTINSDVFQRMRGVQVAVRIQDSSGDTIYTLDPVAMAVETADSLERLSLLFTFNLENKK